MVVVEGDGDTVRRGRARRERGGISRGTARAYRAAHQTAGRVAHLQLQVPSAGASAVHFNKTTLKDLWLFPPLLPRLMPCSQNIGKNNSDSKCTRL